MKRMTTIFCVTLAVGLAGAMSGPAFGGAAPEDDAMEQATVNPERAQEVLMELEEVVVQGKRLQQRIVEAEDEFYKLFNQINTNDDYDTNCPYLDLSADGGSRINSRVCMPVFVANAIADYTVWRRQCQPPLDGFDEFSCLDRNRDERLTWQEAAVRPSLDAQFFMLDADNSGYLTRDELPDEGMSGPVGYQPPPPELVLAEGSNRWYEHTLKVINSDPRLQEMAGRLDDMHRELAAMRRQAGDLEAERAANQPVRRVRGRPPR